MKTEIDEELKLLSNTIDRFISDSCAEIGHKMDQLLLDRYCERILGYKITKVEFIMNHIKNVHVQEFPDGTKDFFAEKDGKKTMLLTIKPYKMESDFVNNRFNISAQYY